MPDQEQQSSPYDALGDKLWSIIGEQLRMVIFADNFAAELRDAGIAVSPVCDGIPEPPREWVSAGLDMRAQVGQVADPLTHLDGLWRVAYEAGWQGYAAQRDDLKAELERSERVKAELRRQLDAQLREVARLRWAARYLPWSIRCQVMVDPPTPGAWRGDRPDEDWATRVDRRATKAGLTPYPGEQT